jgi:hypothetical protein
MNFGRVASAAVVAWLLYLGVSPFVNTVLLGELFARHASLYRPQQEMNLVLGFAASFVGFFVFAYAYAKGYEGGNGLMEGLRFGVIVGLLLSSFALVWNYVMLPLPGSIAIASIVDSIVEMAIYGCVVGLIYKPFAHRA